MNRGFSPRVAAGLLAVLACAPAVGTEAGSAYAEFSFQHPEHGNRGGAFRASAQLGQRLVLDAGLDAREHRGGGVGMASVGVGWRLQDTGSSRIVVGLSADAVGGDFGPDDEPGGMSGVSTRVGVNWEFAMRVNDRVEVLSRLKITTLDASPWVATIGVRYYAWKRLAFGADFLNDDFGVRIGAGFRIDFSRH